MKRKTDCAKPMNRFLQRAVNRLFLWTKAWPDFEQQKKRLKEWYQKMRAGVQFYAGSGHRKHPCSYSPVEVLV
jgi:hypothetical protein